MPTAETRRAGRSQTRLRIVASAAIASVIMLAIQVPGVAADGPQIGTATTGIQIDPNAPRTPTELGYTQAYADAKNSQLDQAVKGRLLTLANTGGVAPMSSTGQNYLSFWVEYHEKTQYNCLPATGQSILAWNFGAANYVGSDVKTSQTAIGNGMGTTTHGTDDYVAFSYLNGRFAYRNSSFRYVPRNDTTLASYETTIVYEIDSFKEPLYTRVDVSSPYYVWHQSTFALHATVSVGYWSSGAETTIGDPYTASTSGCPQGIGYPGYSSTPDQGCIYFGYSTDRYHRAKSGIVSNELPEQW